VKKILKTFVNVEDEENHFHIRSIQIIYKMQFSRKILDRLIYCSELTSRMIREEGNLYLVDDKDQYLKQKKEIIGVYETL
jgi:hypothetical protein